MAAPMKAGFLPDTGPIDVAYLAARQSLDRRLEEEFLRMREECARTLALADQLRPSHHDQFASTDWDVDGRRAWPRR